MSSVRRRCALCDTLNWTPRDRYDGICPKCRWTLGGKMKPPRIQPPKPTEEKPK